MIPRRIHPVIHSFRAFNNWRLDDNCLRVRARAWPQFSGPPQPFDARDKNLFCATTTFHCRRQHPSPNWTCDCPVTPRHVMGFVLLKTVPLPFLFGKRFYLPFLLPLYSSDGGSWRSKVCQMAKVVLDYPPKITSLCWSKVFSKGVFFFFLSSRSVFRHVDDFDMFSSFLYSVKMLGFPSLINSMDGKGALRNVFFDRNNIVSSIVLLEEIRKNYTRNYMVYYVSVQDSSAELYSYHSNYMGLTRA
ncbi:hypothetical protein TNCT_292451 [Trichonephila clavata]|uniref:Uncharacterized protein n=1 Tax=Trichonephila clavata TaxID=2740835 RepID=A0A8X6FRX5_TRICU|nr:hypothetical protein TNCT_292451 [Trichonephila clavata]